MKMGVSGGGKIVQAIALHWARSGHDGVFGNGEGAGPDLDVRQGARVGRFVAAAAHGHAVLLVMTAAGMQATIAVLAGKVLLDGSNGHSPVDHTQDPPEISGAQEIAIWAPDVWAVKIFNTTGVETLAGPLFDGVSATMFYATDAEDAGTIAHGLTGDGGFEPVHAGPLVVARDLERLTRFWGKLAFGRKFGRRIAFKLLRHT